jgi:phenylalanyl-tRNA synthetase alpha chain
MSLSEDLERVRSDARAALADAADAAQVDALRHDLLGRSGELTALMKQLASVAPEDRPALGKLANEIRAEVEHAIGERLEQLHDSDRERRLAAEAIDMSAPGRPLPIGHLHPVQTLMRDLREIFHAFGFEVFEGPEVETEEYNFELLNIPPDHPARDLWDTLYVAEPGSIEAGMPKPAVDGTILRTHTSPTQLRAMRALDAPIRVLTPGRCFRYVRTRFRPGYYPFTEPSVAFDIGCLVCGGDGCPACKRSGWMTILGAGMIHPTVLRNGGFDPDEYQGYAFGMGPDRMAMLRHGIGDIRLFFSADLRFASQFAEGR